MNISKNYIYILTISLIAFFVYYYFDLHNQIKNLNKVTYVNCSLINKIKNDHYENLIESPNDAVFKYITLPLDYTYGSNSIPLTVASLISKGDLLELGMGLFSTPLLHNIAAHNNRKIVSVDTSYDWLKRFLIYNLTKTHEIYHVSESNLYEFGLNKKWGLVLVDHAKGGERYRNVISFSKLAEIVVLHDAEKMSENGYKYEHNKVRSYFLYACKFSVYPNAQKDFYTSTLILSNFIKLDFLDGIFNRIKTDYGHVGCNLNY